MSTPARPSMLSASHRSSPRAERYTVFHHLKIVLYCLWVIIWMHVHLARHRSPSEMLGNRKGLLSRMWSILWKSDASERKPDALEWKSDTFDCGTDDDDYFDCRSDNEDNSDCDTNDENSQDTGSLLHSCKIKEAESEPSLDNNRRVDGNDDPDSRSLEANNSNTGLPKYSSAERQRQTPLSQSPGSSDPVGTLTPDSSDSSQINDAVYTSSFNRQVGVARVRIEQLSLFDHGTTSCEQYTDESQYENDGCPADAGPEASGSQGSGPSGAPPEGSCSTTKRARLTTGNETEAEDSDPDPDDNQGRTRPDQKKQKSGCEGPRFACPYQAFEPSQNCCKHIQIIILLHMLCPHDCELSNIRVRLRNVSAVSLIRIWESDECVREHLLVSHS